MSHRIALSLVIAAGATLAAQQPPAPPPPPAPPGAIELHDVLVAAPAAPAAPMANVHYFSAGEFVGPTVKGQPYTAEAVTEMTRVLADGTRILNKNSSTMARDSEGRSRRENTLSNIGPWAAGNQQTPRFATISDPVAKETLLLDLNARTARRMKAPFNMPLPPAPAGSKDAVFERRVHVVMQDHRGEAGDLSSLPPPAAGAVTMMRREGGQNAKKETLGRQNMEGVAVDGTRETTTVPAGEIGNDRPIQTVTERWYSPELQMVIYSKTIDPQFGETIYRVSNLRRAEPNSDLFKVPADFKMVEGNMIPATRVRQLER